MNILDKLKKIGDFLTGFTVAITAIVSLGFFVYSSIYEDAANKEEIKQTTEQEKQYKESSEDVNATKSGDDNSGTIRTRAVKLSHKNPHCHRYTKINWKVNADVGWKIDPNSIKIKPYTSSKSSYSGIRDASSSGFTISGQVVNRGDCVKVFGKTVARDARGLLSVTGTYKEIK